MLILSLLIYIKNKLSNSENNQLKNWIIETLNKPNILHYRYFKNKVR